MRFIRDAVLCAALACFFLPGAVHGEDAEPPDCEPEAVDFDAGDRLLTRAERVALMEAAFYDSLTRFDECQTAAQGGAGGGAGGSSAAAGVRGTEAQEGDDMPEAGAQERPPAEDIEAAAAVAAESQDAASHGKVPEDIPDGDNDSVLEAQIRLAAMKETDPIIRARLWNQYRQYKGLPVQPVDDGGDDAQISE